MLSRVAENIYWMARYLERAENTARLLAVNANLHLDLPAGLMPVWEPIIAITGSQQLYEQHFSDYSEKNVVKFMLSSKENPSSILSSLNIARENARTIRDIIPREAWELINKHHLFATERLNEGLSKRGRHDYLKQIVLTTQTLTGLLAGTMNHDQGYHFLRIGRNLERADMTTRIVDVRSADLLANENKESHPFETIEWISVLKSLTAYQMYRRCMQVRVRRADVLMFLFQSEVFPRSVLHALREIQSSILTLSNHKAAWEKVETSAQKVMQTPVEKLNQQALHDFIDLLQIDFDKIHEDIKCTWFAPA